MNRLSRTLILTAACAAAAVLPRATAAQEPADTFALDSLVVTATARPLPRAAVPAAVTVVSGAELRARGERLLVDALRMTPGTAVVQTGPQGGLSSVYLRGGESDYVQVLVDGVAVNQPGGSFDFAHLRTEDVERVEIVRGPVSVLYGSDAVTGVIHVITRRGAGRARVSASAGAGRAQRVGDGAGGAAGSLALDAGVSGALGGVDYAVNAAHYATDGAYAFNNEYDNTTASARLGWANTQSGVRLVARWTDGEYHYPTDAAGGMTERNAFRTARALTLGASATHALSTRARLTLDLALHDDDNGEDDAPDSAADTVGFYAYEGTTSAQRRSAEGRVDFDAGAAQLTLGAAMEAQDGETAAHGASQFGPYADSAVYERSSRAGFAQVVLTPARAVTLTAGSRIDDGEYGTFVTWRAGASVRPGAWVLRAAAGTAFKEPTFYENYAQGYVIGNPALEPERSTSFEVGLERALFGERARLGVTAYTQTFDDLIQYTWETAEPGDPNYFNLGEARARGIEVSANIEMAPGLRLDASWDWLEAEVRQSGTAGDLTFVEGERLLRRPEHRISSALQWTRGATSAWLGLTRTGAREDIDFNDPESPGGRRVTLDGYTLVNAAAAIPVRRSSWGSLHATLRIDNLLDTQYEEVIGFPARARAVQLGVRAELGF